MRGKKVESIKKAMSMTDRSSGRLMEFLSSIQPSHGVGFNVTEPIPTTDTSVSEIQAQLMAMSGLVRKLDPNGADLTPTSYIEGFERSLRSFQNTIDTNIVSIKEAVEQHGGLQKFNAQDFTAIMENGNVISFESNFKAIYDASEANLLAFQNAFQSINPSRASFNFAAATASLAEQIAKAHEANSKFGNVYTDAINYFEKIEKMRAEIEAFVSRTQEIDAKASADSEKIQTAAAVVEKQVLSIAEASKNAEALESQVGSYSESFEEFEGKLSHREAEWNSGSEKLSGLIKDFDTQRDDVAELVVKAETMLSSATVAGLASEFNKIKEGLIDEMRSAYTSYRWAIGFLIVSAIPLVLLIFSPLIAPLISDDQIFIAAISGINSQLDGWHYLGQVLSRFAILLPAAWFVVFASSRYNSLFRLREHYSYKYSMAVSVEGFKKQAPGFEDMIAALVLEQLAFNPADKMATSKKISGEEPPNPIMGLLIDKLEKRFTKANGD